MLNNIAALLDSGIAAETNAYESIQTVTVGAGGSSSINFTSIPSTYKHLQLRALARGTNASTAVDMYIRYNGSTSTYYRGHQLYGNGTSALASADATTASGYASYFPAASATASVFGGMVLDILDYTNTNKNKVSRSLTGYDTNGGGFMLLLSSLWQTTSAINQVELICSLGNFAQYSSFALYGIKG